MSSKEKKPKDDVDQRAFALERVLRDFADAANGVSLVCLALGEYATDPPEVSTLLIMANALEDANLFLPTLNIL